MFASRLADQRARLVLMLRQGAVPEDLENEKIVELQLQKKQVRLVLLIPRYFAVPLSFFVTICF